MTEQDSCRIVVANPPDRGAVTSLLRERFPQAQAEGRAIVVARTTTAYAAQIRDSVDRLLQTHGRPATTTIQQWDGATGAWHPPLPPPAATPLPSETEREIDAWYATQTGDEVRLEIDADFADRDQLAQVLHDRLPRDAYFHVAKHFLHLYCVESAAERLAKLVDDAGVPARVQIKRWNWKTVQWQDAALPLPDPPPPPVVLPHPDLCRWEVRIRIDSAESTGLAERARRSGFMAIAADPGVLIAVRDDAERSAALAWAEANCPRARVGVRRFGWFRHWRWRESVFGNYAEGGGPTPLVIPTRGPADLGDVTIANESETGPTR